MLTKLGNNVLYFVSADSTLSPFVTKENFMNEAVVCCVPRNKAET